MSQSVEAGWKAVVKLVQQLPAQDPHQRLATINIIEVQVGVLQSKLGYPRATWKQLIRDLKVPLKLATVCCSLKIDADSSSSSSSSSNMGQASSSSSSSKGLQECAVGGCVWNALDVFLMGAGTGLCCKKGNVPDGANTPSLASAIIAQLQQSGLLQQFPSTLLAAAQLLKDATTTAAASDPVAGSRSRQTAAAAAADCSISSSGGGGGGGGGGGVRTSKGKMVPFEVLVLCKSLAAAIHIMGGFSVCNLLSNEASVLDAAAYFCVALMQHVTVGLDSLQAGSELDSLYRVMLPHAVISLAYAVSTACSSNGKQQLHLLRTPTGMAAVRVLVCIWYAHTLLPQGSSSHPSDDAAVAAAAADQQQDLFRWRTTALFSQQVDPSQLQQPLEPFWQSTGVSMRAAAYAAAEMNAGPTEQIRVAVLTGAATLAQQQTEAVTELQQQHKLTGEVARLRALEAEDNLLLLQLLLCSLEQQPDSLGSNFTRGLGQIAQGVTAQISSMAVCYDAAGVAVLEHIPDDSLATLLPPAAQVPLLVSTWFGCALPTLLALLQRVQQHLSNTHTREAAASTSSISSSGRSGSLTPGSAAANSCTHWDEAEGAAQNAMWFLVMVLHTVNKRGLGPIMVASESSAPVAIPPTGWTEHCVRICSALDTCLRLQASTSGGLGNPMHVSVLVQAVCEMLTTRPLSPLQAAAVLAGPGSKEQQQVFSMLLSLLKACRLLHAAAAIYAAPPGFPSIQSTTGYGCLQAAVAAASFLATPHAPARDQPSRVAAAGPGNQRAADSAAAAGATAGTWAAAAAATSGADPAERSVPTASAAAAVTNSLPALVLFGRCCLLWVQQLQAEQQRDPNLGQRLLLLKHVAADDEAKASELLQVDTQHVLNMFAGPTTTIGGLLQDCWEWLSNHDIAHALAAAGYPAEQLSQELHVLLDLLGKPTAAADSAAALAAFDQVVQQLQAVGLALNTLAFPHACNNPCCSNMSGGTEVASVSGRGNMCAGCLIARYCSKACQTQHWKRHKPVCKALRAAADCNATQADQVSNAGGQ